LIDFQLDVMSEVIPQAPPIHLLQDKDSRDRLNSPPAEHLPDNYDKDNDTKNALSHWQEHDNVNGEITASMWQKTPKTILQQGPQCGLVALAMASESLGLPIELKSLFKEALHMGITKQGEMFSAAGLGRLASCFNINYMLGEGTLNNTRVILELLSQGKVLLVPYDADFNHQPCLKKGHKAHWAVVYGFLIRTDMEDIAVHNTEELGGNCYRIHNLSGSQILSRTTKESVYLIAKQGKSKRVGIWSLSDLAESNANLLEVDPKRNSHLHYVLPVDNKLTDLCGKLIVIG